MEDILTLDLSDNELLNTIVPDNKKPVKSGQIRKKERSKMQEKYLDKTWVKKKIQNDFFCYYTILTSSFACREILKWKYCYLENNPREYPKFREVRKEFKASTTRSGYFKKKFRLKMDSEYHDDMLNVKKHLINKELKETDKDEIDSGIHESVSSKNTVKDPVKLLINYDREVAQKTKITRQNYMVYLQFPKCYPDIATEKENFMKQRYPFKVEKDIEKVELDKIWVEYWSKRIPKLFDQAIDKEKEEIRKKWEGLVSRYEGTRAMAEEFETLLISDDDDDDDVMFVGSVN